MQTKLAWAAAVVFAVVAIAALALAQQNEKPAAAAAAPATLPPDQLVVAAVPYQYETEYEMDPFDRTLLRRTKTRVTHILVIHADGSSEVKQAG